MLNIILLFTLFILILLLYYMHVLRLLTNDLSYEIIFNRMDAIIKMRLTLPLTIVVCYVIKPRFDNDEHSG